jgi:hypothetical protein
MINVSPSTAPAAPVHEISRRRHANLSNQKITLSLAAHRQKTILPEPMNRLAQPRIKSASIPRERPKRLPDVMADHQIGDFILFGRLIIDNHQAGA